MKDSVKITTYFGCPGCGKSTEAIKLAIKAQNKRDFVFLNFDHSLPYANKCNLDKLGEWTFPDNSFIAIDEAGIEYNSRAYKALPKAAIGWFKKHRHYKCDIAIFSQSWEDMDVTLRRLSTELWYLKKIWCFTLGRRIYKRVTVDKNTEQIIDGYRMANVLWLLAFPLYGWLIDRKFTLTFRPFYYQYFDSYSKDNLPVVDACSCPEKTNLTRKYHFKQFCYCGLRNALKALRKIKIKKC